MALDPVWPALQPGDTVAIVAPSGPFDMAGLERGRELLERHFRVRMRPDITTRDGFLAGQDDRRRQELLDALEDPDVRAIVAARGGYGSTRLLAAIAEPALAALATDAKLLVGFSDITALHALWRRAGVGSLHASMAARIASLASPLQARWLAALQGRFDPEIIQLKTIVPGVARGRLAGGNLAVLCALLGTPHMPRLDGHILFLEDTNERPYRVDRMLTSLRDAGTLRNLAGVAVGQFTDCGAGPDGVALEAVIYERLSAFGVPVVSGVPSGHVDDNLELPFGREVELDASAGVVRLS